MENYSYSSYPDSGNSSPRSREVDFENPPPWDEGSGHYKVKFMCSYSGKIHPRPHDNQLAYVGGETKILAVDRTIKFSSMIARLAALSGDADVTFKYQLPGEELDALISVTNDDDLDHLMHEYDRLYRSSAKPARMRLFLFARDPSGKYGSDPDRVGFVEALNSGPAPDPPKPASNVDFLFGLEKNVSPPPPPQQTLPDPVQTIGGPGRDDRGFGPDPAEIQRQLQELQRMQIGGHVPEARNRRNSEDNMGSGGFAGGDYNVQKMPSTVSHQPVSAPTGYWHNKQVHGAPFSGPAMNPPAPAEQPMYVIHGHGGVYHGPPLIRQVSGQPGPGYYAVHQRVPSEVYSVGQPPNQPPPHHQQMSKMVEAARPGPAMVSDGMSYAPVGYDVAAGRQVLYAAGGGVVGPPTQQYQGMAAVTAAMETSRRGAGP